MSEKVKDFVKYGCLKTKITTRSVSWWIQNFRAAREEQKSIRSDFFKVSNLPNCLFYLALVFNDKTYVTLLVYRCSHNNFSSKPVGFVGEITVSFEDACGNLYPTKNFCMTHDIFCVDSSYDSTIIEELCFKGNLLIHCSVSLTESEPSYAQIVSERIKKKIWSHCSVISSNELKEHVEVLLEGDASNKIIIIVDEEEFPVHKNMLCSQSPVFTAMFSHETLEFQQNRINITDIHKEIIGEMIKFIYTGCTSALSPLMNMELYVAADKYGISALKERCSKFLVSSLSRDIILDVLVLAHQHTDNELKNTCIQFLVEKESNLLESEEFLLFIENECEVVQSILLFLMKQNVK